MTSARSLEHVQRRSGHRHLGRGEHMRIAMVGLGKMGANMTERLIGAGHEVVAFDLSPAGQLAQRGMGFVDAGTSGGVWGLTEGYCLMVGGTKESVSVVEPALLSLAPEGGYRSEERRVGKE